MHEPSEAALQMAEALMQHCGVDVEGFRDTGKALISLDGETSLILVVDGCLIHVIAALGQAGQSEEFYLSLLTENFRSIGRIGYRYAVDPETKELLLACTVQTGGLHPGSFVSLFEEIAGFAQRWSRSLVSGELTVPKPTGRYLGEPEAAESQHPPDDPNHLLRV